MFPVLFLCLLLFLLLVDFVFLPRSVRRAWLMMVITFSVAATMVLFTDAWFRLAHFLGIGRPVDILVYTATAILAREMFLSRARQAKTEEQLTELVRATAIGSATHLKTSNTQNESSPP